ncbi:MAG: MBL fold metallo-hydrolase, partial [Oscillibacter sp.]|nr:MBL fold metallo-hydrolase [Oscillibacter sp.]
ALIDCGSGNSWIDAGDTAAQQLRTMGCDSLDYLLLTHYDNDHVSGVTGLLARMEVKTLLLPPDADASGLQTEILSAAKERGSDALTIRRRTNITLGKTTLTVYPPLGEKTDNERGLSLLAMSGTDSILITGDMSQKTEALLLDTYRIPEADVLVAGHHGAKHSTSAALLEALSPETVCISVGSNSYGHPAEQTLQRIAAQGCDVYRTDLQGNIHLSLNP